MAGRPAKLRAKASRAAPLSRRRAGQTATTLRAALMGSHCYPSDEVADELRRQAQRDESAFLEKVHWQVDGHIACLAARIKDARGLDHDAFLALPVNDQCPGCVIVLAECDAIAAADRERRLNTKALVVAGEAAIALGDTARAREMIRKLKQAIREMRHPPEISDREVEHAIDILALTRRLADPGEGFAIVGRA